MCREHRIYEELKAEVRRLQEQGELDAWPSREQRIDWAYGNTVIENPQITREMVASADDKKPPRR